MDQGHSHLAVEWCCVWWCISLGGSLETSLASSLGSSLGRVWWVGWRIKNIGYYFAEVFYNGMG
eukprot:8131611-Ditylum_brightwellii.AAC.1